MWSFYCFGSSKAPLSSASSLLQPNTRTKKCQVDSEKQGKLTKWVSVRVRMAQVFQLTGCGRKGSWLCLIRGKLNRKKHVKFTNIPLPDFISYFCCGIHGHPLNSSQVTVTSRIMKPSLKCQCGIRKLGRHWDTTEPMLAVCMPRPFMRAEQLLNEHTVPLWGDVSQASGNPWLNWQHLTPCSGGFIAS